MAKPTEAGAQAGSQEEAPDYDDGLDTIVGWDINRKDSTVTLTTKRSTDNTERKVPEERIQRINEKKLIEYWSSFNQAREDTIKCATYRVFQILGHKPDKVPKLLIHWVGYTADPTDGSASWEPLDVILRSSETLVLDYLRTNGLTRQLTPEKQGRSAAATTASTSNTSTATTPASTTKPTTAGRGRGRPPRRTRVSPGGAATASSEAPPATHGRESGGTGDQKTRATTATTPSRRSGPGTPARASTPSPAGPPASEERRPSSATPPAKGARGKATESEQLVSDDHIRFQLNVDGVEVASFAIELPRGKRNIEMNITPMPPSLPLGRWIPGPDKKRRRTTIYQGDITRLDEGRFLNDNIIYSYLRYLHSLGTDAADSFYFLDSFFYSALKSTNGKLINYDRVKRWTSRVDIFKHRFLVVPINQANHWWVAVICIPPNLEELKIITLDSLGLEHKQDCERLEKYLRCELLDKKKLRAGMSPTFTFTAGKVPQQSNEFDCGVYLISYVEALLADPGGFVQAILGGKSPDFTVDAPALRREIRKIMLEMLPTQEEQEAGTAG
ncbi:hypothetical protein GGTG_14274 [Gaeumannomyces tritici R3-111a-1]|uniref:Ubiquitin-like protease family profile domain-containing protein n=1 Tax=Gaeumannomyces tritici (strain R3-111a-1) TaxID=644352 RepID=J3PL31_GAET3|nr:hypothetical protein GGTG_14274 [Gaeumannomyces tritici R3-111a-1]EJT68148.1 hypothetical protein GGTG_14274 [Gaeumannomyces tritici R3-111a-1]